MISDTNIAVRSDASSLRPPPRPGVDPPPLELSKAQYAAVELLITGASVAKVAEQVGVDKGTIHRWKASDPNFIAALNRWRGTVQAETRDRLLAISAGAADSVARSIADGDGRLGFMLLDKMRCLEPGPDQPVDPYAVFGVGREDESARRPIAEGFARVSRAMTPEQRLCAPQLLALGVLLDNQRIGRISSQDLVEMAGPQPEQMTALAPVTSAESAKPFIDDVRGPVIPVEEANSAYRDEALDSRVTDDDLPRRRVKSRVVLDPDDADPCVRYGPSLSIW